jgi:hypothetical protein
MCIWNSPNTARQDGWGHILHKKHIQHTVNHFATGEMLDNFADSLLPAVLLTRFCSLQSVVLDLCPVFSLQKGQIEVVYESCNQSCCICLASLIHILNCWDFLNPTWVHVCLNHYKIKCLNFDDNTWRSPDCKDSICSHRWLKLRKLLVAFSLCKKFGSWTICHEKQLFFRKKNIRMTGMYSCI